MKLRIIFIIMLLILATLGFSQDPVTLRVSVWDYNPYVDNVFFDEFQKIHPNIKLTIESESWSNYYTKLRMQLMTGTAPDVMMFNASSIYPYCDQNILLNLSDFIEESNFDVNALFSNSLESCKWKDHLYGLPFNNDVSVLYINADLFQQYKIDIPSVDSIMTWSNFQDLCQQLDENIKDNSIDYVYIENIGWKEFYSAVLQNDALIFDRLEDPTKCLLNTPEAIEACEYYFNFSLKYKYSPTLLEYNSVLRKSPSNLFIQGKLPIYLGRIGDNFLLDSDIDFDVRVIPRPKGKKRITFVDVRAITINSKSKHTQESWKLLKYFTSPKAQKLIAKGEAMGKLIPSLKEVAYSENFLPESIIARRVFLDELEYSIPLVKTIKIRELGSAMFPILDQLAMRRISIEKAMNEITEKANKVLLAE